MAQNLNRHSANVYYEGDIYFPFPPNSVLSLENKFDLNIRNLEDKTICLQVAIR